MTTREAEENLAANWVKDRGYEPERPIWLPKGKGKRDPDYWAHSNFATPTGLWVEVKSIDEDDSSAALAKFWKLAKAAKIPAGLHGHALLNIDPAAIEQSVRKVIKLFEGHSQRFAGQKAAISFVQQTEDGTDVQRLEIQADQPIVIWVRGAGERKLAVDAIFYEFFSAPAKLIDHEYREKEGRVFEFCEGNEAFQCSLSVHLDPSEREIDGISTMSGGSSQVRTRTASALEDANRQIKSACESRPAPGGVFLIPRGPRATFADDHMVQMACYGVLTVPLTLRKEGGPPEMGTAHHGEDGVFRPDKNTHISAAIRIDASGSGVFFPNPFSARPISDDASILRGVRRASVDFG